MVQSKWPKIFRNETFLPRAFSFFCAILLSSKLQLTKGYFFSGWNSSETLASWRRSKCALATKRGKSPSPLENSTFSPMDQAKLSCSLWKQPWPKFLSQNSFPNFVSSCAVCCEFIFNIMCQMCYRLFFCRYLQTEDELPDQENRKSRGRRCAFLWVSPTAGWHKQTIRTKSTSWQHKTAQNI